MSALPVPIARTTGLVYELPNEVYHSGPELSNSGISDLLRSPLHYYALHLDPARPPREELRSQLHGTLAHCAILEADAFDNRYIVGPDVNKNTKIWKEFVASFPDRQAIDQEQYDTAFAQAASVRALPDIAQALDFGTAEVSAYWIDGATGVLCRCRPDLVASFDGGDVIMDLKTFSTASPEEFGRQAARMSYDTQAYWYSHGYANASGRPVIAFINIIVETDWPYAASAVQLDERAVELGRRKCLMALELYARCRETGVWPGYPQGIVEVSLPNYAFNGFDNI